MKKAIIAGLLILSGCQLTLAHVPPEITKADLEARDAQLKQIVSNIAAALDQKVDKPQIAKKEATK